MQCGVEGELVRTCSYFANVRAGHDTESNDA